jgi:membrane-associated protease RseP (regulator of RpoE activity)
MTEDQNVETLTAKTTEPGPPAVSPKKGRGWVKVLIWVLAICLALGVGAVVGGGVVYGVMRVSDRLSIGGRLPTIRGRAAGPEVVTIDMPTSAALIVEVTEDGPADRAGLKVGDVVVAVEGQELDPDRDLAELIAGHKPGDRVTLEVRESGGSGQDSRQVTVELGEHPQREGVAYLGVSFVPAPGFGLHWEGRSFDCDETGCGEWPFGGRGMPFSGNVPLERGAIVQSVVEDSPASDAGLRSGDVITAIDGEPVEAPGALSETIGALEPGDEITLTVYRSEGEEELQIAVTLGEHPDGTGAAYLGVQLGGFFHMERFWGDDKERGPFQFSLPRSSSPGSALPGNELRPHFEFNGMPQGVHLEWSTRVDNSL